MSSVPLRCGGGCGCGGCGGGGGGWGWGGGFGPWGFGPWGGAAVMGPFGLGGGLMRPFIPPINPLFATAVAPAVPGVSQLAAMPGVAVIPPPLLF